MVIKHPTLRISRAVQDLVFTALSQGGSHLDCYATYTPHDLVYKYAALGFEPVAWLEFSHKYAPEDWNYDAWGEPDVVLWVHNGDAVEEIVHRKESYRVWTKEDIHALPKFEDYDEAKAYQQAELEKRKSARMGIDGKAGAEQKRYSISRTQAMSWAEQIDGALYGGKNIRRNDTLVVGDPAETVVANEIEHKPLAVPLSVLTKAHSGKDISHSIKKGKLALLDDGIRNAPLVIVNPARNAVVYMTDIKQGGLPIVVSFDMNASFDGDDVHKATSIHLQVDTQAMLESLPESATVYIKNEPDSVGATNNLRGLAAKIKFIGDSIARERETVKMSLFDSDGRQLSEAQQEFFKDSKVRDKEGNLLVMYHGTANGGNFTIFDGNKLSNSSRTSQIGQGFYFTSAKNEAQAYTKNMDPITGRVSSGKNPFLHEVYLDVKKPFNVKSDRLDLEDAKAVFLDGTYGWFFDSWIPHELNNRTVNGVKYTESEVQRMDKTDRVSLFVDYHAKHGAKAVLSNMVRAFPSGAQAELLSSMKNRLGYDGIVEEFKPGQFQYVVFDSSQVKSIDNTAPTRVPDIRHSIQTETDDAVANDKQLDYNGFGIRYSINRKQEAFFRHYDGGIQADDYLGMDAREKRIVASAIKSRYAVLNSAATGGFVRSGDGNRNYFYRFRVAEDSVTVTDVLDYELDAEKIDEIERSISDDTKRPGELRAGRTAPPHSRSSEHGASDRGFTKTVTGESDDRVSEEESDRNRRGNYGPVVPDNADGRADDTETARREIADSDETLRHSINPETGYEEGSVQDGVLKLFQAEDIDGESTISEELVSPYNGKCLLSDSSVYDYDFLVGLPDMAVVDMPPLSEVKTGNNVDRQKAIDLGLRNAESLGRRVSDTVCAVTNRYTGREIRIGRRGLGHSLDGGNIGRLRTNARLTAVAGSVIQNAVPVNALSNKNAQAQGTYALAGLLKSGDRDVVAIVTVEQHTDLVTGIDFVDIAHAINGRVNTKEAGRRSSTRETGFDPATASYKISIADFLDVVNLTHQSILSA